MRIATTLTLTSTPTGTIRDHREGESMAEEEEEIEGCRGRIAAVINFDYNVDDDVAIVKIGTVTRDIGRRRTYTED